jgi:uncharacterized protein YndB with AHSA1/START domain
MIAGKRKNLRSPDMAAINQTIEINANANKLFEALTTESGYRSWWTVGTNFDNRPEGIAVYKFGGDQNAFIFQLKKIEENKLVSMKCVSQVKSAEWQDTNLTFEIESKGKNSRLNLKHENWAAETEMYSMCTYGWQHFLSSLKSYLEEGKGQPALNVAEVPSVPSKA